eukprot:CAMPEP_0196746188 /NCGR_PEP_ID=MMETSP1091-20130531/64945_1 /TAXON_ID=302021 /ORGANISM="Rhodomonas sp., Strain CCMP768" /LENGTH=31 /DNA_ID= /DNA_START= /DNA_END= /DNA_ORIENTATION=
MSPARTLKASQARLPHGFAAGDLTLPRRGTE